MIGVLTQIVRGMIDSYELKPDQVREYTEKFARPPNIGEAEGKLKENRVVVLAGPRGCGRRMSAVWLLNQMADLKMHEVERELDESFLTRNLGTEDHVGWLLDLRDDEAKVQQSFGSTLAASQDFLEDQSSYLAVIIREDLWSSVGIGGEKLLVTLTPARADNIIKRYLTKAERVISEDDANTWLEHPPIKKHIERLMPPDAVLWAKSIHAEHFTLLESGSDAPEELTAKVLAAKAQNVLNARLAWRNQLLEWYKVHHDGRERAFLLAAAALENMPAEQVFTGSGRLAVALGNEGLQPTKGLAGPGIIQLVDAIEADLSSAEAVHFRRPGYADAILEYFWTDRMHLRDRFINWLSTDEALTKRDQDAEAAIERIGQYILLWSIRRNKLDLIEKVIKAWAESKKLSGAAEKLMTAAGLDPVLGKSMRERMLTWARNETVLVKLVVARACGGPLGRVYPGIMLFRIGELADSEDPEIAKAVKAAMRSLWDISRTREGIRKEILKWCSSDSRLRQAAARSSFTAIAGLVDESGFPVALPLNADSEYQTSAGEADDFSIRGWRCILDYPRPGGEAIYSFSTWMDTAATSERAYAAVRDIFTGAVYRSADDHFNDRRHTTLSHLLYSWAPASTESPEKMQIRDDLLETVLRLDPLRRPREEAQRPNE